MKKIFNNEADEYIKRQFRRFGKGEYERAALTISNGKNLNIKSSYEFSNDLFHMLIQNLKEPVQVTGLIVSNEPITDFEHVKKKQKLYEADINENFSPEKLKEIYEKYKSQNILLSFEYGSFKLKSGIKLPKPGKKLKENFCSASLPKEFLHDLLFDYKEDFKKVIIKHIYNINEIVIPEEFKHNVELARINAKRKGTILRILEVDGKKVENKKEFTI